MMNLRVWRITGQEHNDSSGGENSWVIVLPEGGYPDFPELVAKLESLRPERSYDLWGCELVGTIPGVLEETCCGSEFQAFMAAVKRVERHS